MIPSLCCALTVVMAALNFLLQALCLLLGIWCLCFFALCPFKLRTCFQHVLQVSEEAVILHLAGFELHCSLLMIASLLTSSH